MSRNMKDTRILSLSLLLEIFSKTLLEITVFQIIIKSYQYTHPDKVS
jgi:hypothetical protein